MHSRAAIAPRYQWGISWNSADTVHRFGPPVLLPQAFEIPFKLLRCGDHHLPISFIIPTRSCVLRRYWTPDRRSYAASDAPVPQRAILRIPVKAAPCIDTSPAPNAVMAFWQGCMNEVAVCIAFQKAWRWASTRANKSTVSLSDRGW